MEKTLFVSLLGSNRIYLEQLTNFLNNQHLLSVTSTVKTSYDLLNHLSSAVVDAVIISLEMPFHTIVQTVESVRRTCGENIAIIVANTSYHYHLEKTLKKAGANILLDHEATSEHLIDALMGSLSIDSSRTVTNKKTDSSQLTKRESEICRLICKGKSCPEIAEKLFVSIRTVENHKANIFRKLEVGSVTQMMEKAIVNGYYFI
jgi:DNA-binding NarL/FixJ family response regulator